jgi:hypothetical protein
LSPILIVPLNCYELAYIIYNQWEYREIMVRGMTALNEQRITLFLSVKENENHQLQTGLLYIRGSYQQLRK